MEQPFVDGFMSYVNDGDIARVMEFFAKEELLSPLIESVWEVVPQICTLLTAENEQINPQCISVCEKALIALADKGEAKELLLLYLEQAEMIDYESKYHILLRCVEKVLNRLDSNIKRLDSYIIAIETFHKYVDSVELPKAKNLEQEERKLLFADENYRKIARVCNAFWDFINAMVMEISAGLRNDDTFTKYSKARDKLSLYCVKILQYPLGQLDFALALENDTKVKSEARLCAERLMKVMSMLHPNLLHFVEWMQLENKRIECENEKRRIKREEMTDAENDDEAGDDDEEIWPAYGIGVLVYLAFGERLGSESIPQVLSPLKLLKFTLPFIIDFLRWQDEPSVLKGLTFFDSMQAFVAKGTLTVELLESELVQDLIKAGFAPASSSPSKQIRKLAVDCISDFRRRFNHEGRFRIIMFLFTTYTQPQVAAFCILLIKEEIDEGLKAGNLSPYFSGAKLEQLANRIFALPGGKTCDLIERHEHVMGALNILRYFIIADKLQQNKTGIWNIVEKIENGYMETLRFGIEMSRAHYKLDLDKVRAQPEAEFGNGLPEMNVEVHGDAAESKKRLTKQQHLQVLQTGIHTFDMMQSVMCRVLELIAEQKKDFAKRKLGHVDDVRKDADRMEEEKQVNDEVAAKTQKMEEHVSTA